MAHLQADDRARLAASVDWVHLERSRILADVGDPVKYVYFPVRGLVSLMSLTSDDEAVEVAMVGRDGFVGLPAALRVDEFPYRLIVQLPTDAFRLRADAFIAELRRNRPFEDAVLQHAHAVLAEIAQSAVCHRFHTATQRLCRWLLISHDHVNAPTIDLTQEFIAHMLGVPRNTVSASAIVLQDEHIIEQRHGRIRIINRRALERLSCECYRIVSRETGGHTDTHRPATVHDRSRHR